MFTKEMLEKALEEDREFRREQPKISLLLLNHIQFNIQFLNLLLRNI